MLVGCTDGVGTKVLLAIEMGVHDSIGQDCVAMNVNDLIVQGAEPLFFLDYIGTHAVDPAHMERIVRGVADGCAKADCALIGGETAEMPDVYKKGDYDVAGFTVGVVELEEDRRGRSAGGKGRRDSGAGQRWRTQQRLHAGAGHPEEGPAETGQGLSGT